MKKYDAKDKQKCLICSFTVMHNKQGKFTSHLLNEHNLSLHVYLLSYFYEKSDLRCSYSLCDNLVNLRRGIPKKHCSKSCAGKGHPLVCLVCLKEFEARNRQTKTCSQQCTKIRKSLSAKRWHASMTTKEKELHFRNIINKTAATRKKNGTPSWNSGKTNIYTQETIDKIRAATLKQMENQVFKKTKIEKKIEEYLINVNINYKYSFILEKRQFDFLLIDYNVIIECDGDYWHANPKFYPSPENWQLERIETDSKKNEIACNNGFRILRFWEDDILNDFDKVKSIINGLLATT